MLHRPLPLIAVLFGLFLILLILATLMFNPFRKSIGYEKMGVRDFSCPNLGSFSFSYPVFKGLENVSQQACELRIKKSDKDWTVFTITVTPVEHPPLTFDQVNPNGIPYLWNATKNEYLVKLDSETTSSVVSIKTAALPIWQTNTIRKVLDTYSETIISTLERVLP